MIQQPMEPLDTHCIHRLMKETVLIEKVSKHDVSFFTSFRIAKFSVGLATE